MPENTERNRHRTEEFSNSLPSLLYLIVDYKRVQKMLTFSPHEKRTALCALHFVLALATFCFGRVIWLSDPATAILFYFLSFFSAIAVVFLVFENYCTKLQEQVRERNAKLEIVEALRSCGQSYHQLMQAKEQNS